MNTGQDGRGPLPESTRARCLGTSLTEGTDREGTSLTEGADREGTLRAPRRPRLWATSRWRPLPADPVGEGALLLTPHKVRRVVHGPMDRLDVGGAAHLVPEVLAMVQVVVDAVGQLQERGNTGTHREHGARPP